MSDINCIKCNLTIYLNDNHDVRCPNCGAYYKLKDEPKLNTNYKDVIFNYEFSEFRCINSSFINVCNVICPAPHMYCKDHSDENCIDMAQRDILYSEKRLSESKDRLARMYDSRKTWLIQKMSGIDEK